VSIRIIKDKNIFLFATCCIVVHAIRINEQPIAAVVVPMAVGGEAPLEFDGILEHLLVGIEIRAM